MSCKDCEDEVLSDFCAGATYPVGLGPFTDVETGRKVDIEGRTYFMTLKRQLSLTDAQATGANGAQVSVTATADDSAASLIWLTLTPDVTRQLSGDYFADIWEITPGTPEIRVPVLPTQKVSVTESVFKGSP